MGYTFETDESKKIITIKVVGDMRIEEAASLGMEMRLLAKREKSRLFFNSRLARFRITVLEAYYWVDKYYDSVDPHLKWIPAAYLINQDDEAIFRFLETTFRNRTANVRLFMEEAAAISWLVSQPVQ